jgi:hypothetical protein
MHQPYAACRDRPHTRGNLVGCSRAPKDWAAIVRVALVLTFEPSLDLTFEPPQLSL